MPTERAAALLIGSAFAWLLGRFLGVPELYVLAAASSLLPVLAVALVWLPGRRLEVDRAVSPRRIAWGGTSRSVVRLRNPGRLPTGLLLVEDPVHYGLTEATRFAVPALPPGVEVRLVAELHGGARGRHEIGPLRVRRRDPFGLAERAVDVGDAAELLVHPRVESIGEGLPEAPGDGGGRQRSLLHGGDEFATLRAWAPGDDLRLVHWPSTARRGQVLVRQFEQSLEADTALLCDTRAAVHHGAGSTSSFEAVLSAAASVAAHLARHHHRLRLVLPDDAAAQAEELERVMDRLAAAAPAGSLGLGPALARLGAARHRGALVAVVAPPAVPVHELAGHPDVRALVAAGAGHRVRLALVVETGRGPAELLVGTLRAAGWQAATHRPGTPLAPAWRTLTSAGPHLGVGR